ncbi:MAG: hypothetical protein G01um101429_278 [Parcubacteria group bacterium Gr01-1014_29]|nr:MAG: hypothetical protein G01um101429_278 [Parcubacteria group bacterium Gr01-1014_29]
MWERMKENKDLIVVAIASFFIGFGAASFFGDTEEASVPDGIISEKEDRAPLVLSRTQPENKTETLTVENQRAGSSVQVLNTELTEPQWVVVREVSEDGKPGNFLGAAWLPAGVHNDVSVALLGNTVGGEQYIVALFSDEGADKKFDHTVDKAFVDAAGNEITAKFSTVASPTGF